MPGLDDTLFGMMLDEYRVERSLGKGGMARVYLALDTRLQRYVALKVIAPDLRADKEYTLRFEHEAQSIARLDHPNVVRIFRFGVAAGMYYMAMQYIDGADLERVVKAYRRDGELMALSDVARIIQDTGAALDYAHSRHVIHRDVKPGNIMLDQSGRAVLTDFGLALLRDVATPGEIFGSPYYIAPEQAVSPGKVVPQSDLYALGAVLFYLLTGEVLFPGSDPMDVAMRHVSEAPRLPSAINPALTAEIDAVVLRCLEKAPQDRFQTGAELSAALNVAIAADGGARAPAEGALRHSHTPIAAKISEAQTELPPLPEVDTVPPTPAFQQTTLPATPAPPISPPVPATPAEPPQPASSTWMRSPAPAQPAERPEPAVLLVGALRRVRPNTWIALGLGAGALLIVALCGLVALAVLNRDAGPSAAVVVDSPTPDASPTDAPSATPSPLPSPTRTAIPTPTPLVLFGTMPSQPTFPTTYPPVFPPAFPPAQPTMPVFGVVPPDRNAAPPGSRRLGEFAVEWYCNERGLGVMLVNGDADWACTNPDGTLSFILQVTDFDQICRSWYTNPNAFAVRDQQKPTQAYNWSCYELAVQGMLPGLPSNPASNVTVGMAGLATPSVTSLRIEATRDWVAFSNDSTVPLSLADFWLERDGRRIDASAWGRDLLNPGECLVIHKDDELPDAVLSECALPVSLAMDKRDREYWLKGEVLVHVNPDAQYRYRPERR